MRRFTHSDYARCRELDVGHGKGVFRRIKAVDLTGLKGSERGHRLALKNGTYELRILPGYPGNALCESFRIEIHQTPDDGRKLPVIMYPPKSGSKTHCVVTENIREVSSPLKVMRETAINGVQSPSVYFDLAEHLQDPTLQNDRDRPACDKQKIMDALMCGLDRRLGVLLGSSPDLEIVETYTDDDDPQAWIEVDGVKFTVSVEDRPD